ncbi:MAG: hypothetical protein Q7T03_07790, partial [Deltaproteobacteria bacterium]|nr:hypothetical protein [Deltaproteobacteria bacterium]
MSTSPIQIRVLERQDPKYLTGAVVQIGENESYRILKLLGEGTTKRAYLARRVEFSTPEDIVLATIIPNFETKSEEMPGLDSEWLILERMQNAIAKEPRENFPFEGIASYCPRPFSTAALARRGLMLMDFCGGPGLLEHCLSLPDAKKIEMALQVLHMLAIAEEAGFHVGDFKGGKTAIRSEFLVRDETIKFNDWNAGVRELKDMSLLERHLSVQQIIYRWLSAVDALFGEQDASYAENRDRFLSFASVKGTNHTVIHRIDTGMNRPMEFKAWIDMAVFSERFIDIRSFYQWALQLHRGTERWNSEEEGFREKVEEFNKRAKERALVWAKQWLEMAPPGQSDRTRRLMFLEECQEVAAWVEEGALSPERLMAIIRLARDQNTYAWVVLGELDLSPLAERGDSATLHDVLRLAKNGLKNAQALLKIWPISKEMTNDLAWGSDYSAEQTAEILGFMAMAGNEKAFEALAASKKFTPRIKESWVELLRHDPQRVALTVTKLFLNQYQQDDSRLMTFFLEKEDFLK